MSRIQESAKTYIVLMLEGRAVTLYKPAQSLLSAWCTMAVVIVDQDPRTHPAIPPADRYSLKNTSRPPSHWRIWLGFHPKPRKGSLSIKIPIRLFPEDKSDIDSYSSGGFNTQTMAFFAGPIFFYAMSSSLRLGRKAIKRWAWPSDIGPKLTQIWPVTRNPIPWPLRQELTRSEADFIGESFLTWLRMTADTVDR